MVGRCVKNEIHGQNLRRPREFILGFDDGRFEGILLNGGIPSGKVYLLANSTGAFTGTLSYNGKVYSLKNALTLDSVTAPTYGQVTITLPPALSLTVKVLADSSMTATLVDGPTVSTVAAPEGVQLKTYTSAFPAPWMGSYTLVLPKHVVPGVGPQGSGYGLVTIDFKGGLQLNGKLADGTVITAYLPTDTVGGYRPYIQLYANKLGYLAGTLQLQQRLGSANKYDITAGSGSDIWWSKAPVPNDKGIYPAGFGPIQLLSPLMEPWIVPTNSYLIGPLGLLTNNSQTIGNFGLTLTQTSNILVGEMLPTSLKMDALSRVTVLNPSNPTGFTVKIVTKTGAFTGSFTLSGNRKATVQGVLLQLPVPASLKAFGRGFFIVPPGPTGVSGDVQFTIP